MTGSSGNDEADFAAYCRGNMAAFDALYSRYRQPLYLFLRRLGHGESAAEDIFHDGWMRVINQRESFDGNHFRGWIFQIMRNLSIDNFRRQQIRDADELDERSTPDNAAISMERQQQGIDCIELMKNSIAALPIDQRDVFLLKEEAGLSLQQIAEMMQLGRETIKSRVRYAMKSLKQMLADCL